MMSSGSEGTLTKIYDLHCASSRPEFFGRPMGIMISSWCLDMAHEDITGAIRSRYPGSQNLKYADDGRMPDDLVSNTRRAVLKRRDQNVDIAGTAWSPKT